MTRLHALRVRMMFFADEPCCAHQSEVAMLCKLAFHTCESVSQATFAWISFVQAKCKSLSCIQAVFSTLVLNLPEQV